MIFSGRLVRGPRSLKTERMRPAHTTVISFLSSHCRLVGSFFPDSSFTQSKTAYSALHILAPLTLLSSIYSHSASQLICFASSPRVGIVCPSWPIHKTCIPPETPISASHVCIMTVPSRTSNPSDNARLSTCLSQLPAALARASFPPSAAH